MFESRGLRVGVFVDIANVHASARNVFGHGIDYEKLLNVAVSGNVLYRAIMYAVRHGEKMDGWTKAMNHIGFEVREKEPIPREGRSSKANWDIGICMDVLRMVSSSSIDLVVLVSGDGDFEELITRCHEFGKLVRVFSVGACTSHLLINACDDFIPVDANVLRSDEEVLEGEDRNGS